MLLLLLTFYKLMIIRNRIFQIYSFFLLLKYFTLIKVVKQTVMTTVYNVTLYGASLQINRQLEALPEYDDKKKLGSSLYIANLVFESIKELFKSAKEIQVPFFYLFIFF